MLQTSNPDAMAARKSDGTGRTAHPSLGCNLNNDVFNMLLCDLVTIKFLQPNMDTCTHTKSDAVRRKTRLSEHLKRGQCRILV